MIEIVGKIKNAVDCGCYEIQAVPAPEPKAEREDCCCDEQPATQAPEEVTSRVPVDAKLSFVIRVENAQLSKWFEGRQPRFYFRVYSCGELKLTTAESFVWRQRKPPMELVIDLCPPKAPPACGKVCGTVTDCRGNPLAGMRVRIFDVDLHDVTSLGGSTFSFAWGEIKPPRPSKVRTPLGETVTNECGEYCVCYKYTGYADREIDTADIRVVVGPRAGTPFRALQVSDIQFNAPASLIVDLAVPGSELDGSGEFMEYHVRLWQLGSYSPDARKALTNDELDFVSSEAGIPVQHLVLLRRAYEIDGEFFRPLEDLPDHFIPQILYGLLRMGVTGPFPSWARCYPDPSWDVTRMGDKLGSLIDSAIKKCVIDRSLGFGAGPVSTNGAGLVIWIFSFFHALVTPLLPNRSSWAELFGVVFPLPANVALFMRFGLAWMRFGVGKRMWDDLALALGAADLEKLKKLVRWAEISGFYAPAVVLFYRDEPGLLAAAGSDAQWAGYFWADPSSVSPAPAGIPFPDYSMEVRERARAYFGADAAVAWAGGVNASHFLPLTLTNAEARRSAERLSRLTTSAEFAAKLAAARFTSARDIAALRWEDFRTRVGEGEGSVQALYVYTKARETRAVAIASTLQLSPALNSPFENLQVPFLGAPDFVGTSLEGIADSLFGSGSSCDCEGRQSVFSPGAYLHALRRFLANILGLPAGARGGRDLFDYRRPEVKDLQLSYVNAYTALPTIDLNNEVLEDLAAAVLNSMSIPITVDLDRQTTREASELELQVEYENAAVYAAFAGRVRPWRFPFDLNHAKRRIYLDAIGLAREEVLRLAALVPSAYELSDAVLDLNPAQLPLLESGSALAYSATLAQLSDPLTMMEQAQIGFQDLYAITRLKRIYSGVTPVITAPSINPEVDGSGSAPCDPSTYELNDAPGSTSDPTDPQADRIHRFVRLWRALPWPMHLLDWAIGDFHLEPLETPFPLKWLGAAELIRKRLKLKPHEVIAFWAPLSIDRWAMPFVKTKAIPSPWEQVFRVPFADLTIAAAARSSGISQQFAEKLATSTPFSDADATRFFRYGRLSKAIPGLQPEDIKRYEDLRGLDVFGSPADTWTAIQDFEVVRRTGARLSTVFPLYMPQADPGTPLERREMLATIEDLNRRTRLPDDAPFEAVLARFVPEATVSLVADTLALYETPGARNAVLDDSLAEMLSLPQLLTPPLSAELSADSTATHAEKDEARKDRILTELSEQLWDRDIAGLLARASGLDTATARLIADNVETSDASTITARLKGFLGDGGDWADWPAGVDPAPGAQLSFLEDGVIDVPPEAVTSEMTAVWRAQILAAAPGDYEVLAKASYTAAGGERVEINTFALPPGQLVSIHSFTVKERDAASHSVPFTLTVDTACRIELQLVEPSGSAQPLPGTRFYPDPGPGKIDGALEALELMALSGGLASQWKLGADDLSALVRLQSGSSDFPSFPPKGDPGASRPLASADGAGFVAWLEYARLVAALKMARGEGRRVLYDIALAAQPLGAADPAQLLELAEPVCSGIAAALDLETKYVIDAAHRFSVTVKGFGDAGAWLRLFDLSRALQEHGVSADTFAAWSDPSVTDDAVRALEAAVHAKLAQSRSGAEKLREAVDKIRALKRDVLSDYLLANPPGSLAWRTRKDISDYLLTDIEMEPCAQTSRIRFAIAAAQRLVTQALAQSEPLRLNAEQEREWQSIFQYRLWEVRQKILLYPENWLKFGRHLHKSPEFEELERSLLQGDLTEEKAWEALTHYVEQMHGIGHLEIVGSCSQQEFDATGAASVDLLHVVGRTPAEPRAYYHRRRVDGAYWTPWQKIELDIDCDQIVPVVHNRQLHLFWLVPDTASQEKPNVKKDERQIALEDKYKTLRLAWSVLTSKGWRAKMIGKDSLSTRCGHYAANFSPELGTAHPYVEVHAWNQAAQDIGTYQLRPTLSAEGDAVIEIYASLESTVVSKIDKGIHGWVYEVRSTLDRFGLGSAWFGPINSAATATLNGLVNEVRSTVSAKLQFASPTAPAITPSGTRTATLLENRLLGTFRLTPDNLVEVRSRSAEFNGGAKYLTAAERTRTLAGIGSAVSRSGAYEFDDGSVELHAGGAYRTVLAKAGTPVRVVVTRQETVPSQRDPVFCRIKNRAFFAFKDPDPLPPVSLRVDNKAGWRISNAFQTSPREHVDRITEDLDRAWENPDRAGDTASWGLAMVARVGHGAALANNLAASVANSLIVSTGTAWRFALAHHPQTIELLRAAKAGLDRLYNRETQNDSRAATGSLSVPFDFDPDYGPDKRWVDTDNLPEDELEFQPDQAYAVQNWELLYHSPMMVAQQLMRVGRFDDARRWIARVFNPRDPAVRDTASGPPNHPENYWVFKPFVDFVAGNGVGDFKNLNPNGSGDAYLRRVFRALIKQWRANPYNPHAVAAFRPQAYQLASIFLYVENLIAWGDSLFAAPSAELVEEAARRYEEAEHVIGRPPVSTGAIRYDAPASSVADLETGVALGGTDPALGGADLENALSVGDGPSPQVEDAFLPDLAIGYFCLPPNPKIKELRDKIQDRLFKAHHCLDLLGNPRKLPLYDPPIDPALLADAAMAGLNVSQAVMDAYTPRPHYRFRTLLALAKGIVQQVTSLGSGLLSSMEKRDAESLSLLKATHEAKLLERASAVRKLQVEDAGASIKALEATLKSVEFRQEFYETREFMNPEETAQIVLSLASTIFRSIGQALNAAASAAGAVPDFTAGGAGAMASPVAVVKTGGENFRRVPAGLGLAMSAVGDFMGTFSSIAGSMGSFRRRKEDWDFQAESAELEGKQINAQILGAKIRQTIAERELANHEAQIEQSREELDFVRTKQTSVSLYEWLAADIGATYYRAFQLAHSMALQAQRALQDELGSNARYIGYSHWNGSRNGLQAGERLMQELLEMESQYHGQNARPVVKTMNVSLAQVDPIALAELKVKGSCNFDLTEAYWDRYAPGLYFRRFASVSVSVPAVVGPFSGLHGRLSIERACYRKDPSLPDADGGGAADSYVRQGTEDTRFVDQFPRPGDFIVLSTGARDTGLGGDEQKEDRYRPFENLGVDSTWRLDISQRDNAFDLSTISDVVLHVEYTARDGGKPLTDDARDAQANLAAEEGFLVSLRHQYASQWQAFRSGGTAELDFKPQLSGWASNRDGRRLASLEVAVLLRVKEQPEAETEAAVTVTLGLPSAFLAALVAVDVAGFGDFDVSFDLPADGGLRFGFDSRGLDLADATGDVFFAALHSAPWTIGLAPGSGIEPEDLEDAVVCVKWSLDGSP
jgi:hypothetical protein